MFFGVDEVVFGVAPPATVVPSPPEADVAAAPDPPVPVAAPDITPVYVALNAETAARTLEGSGAIVPPLYWLHCEMFNSVLSMSLMPYASEQ